MRQQLDAVDADLDQWRDILTLATRFAANCRTASNTAKRQLNHAVFVRITLCDGHIHRWEFQPPFDVVFNRLGLNTEVTWTYRDTIRT